MTTPTIKAKITRAILLKRAIKKLTAQLEAIKAELIAEADGRGEEQTKTEGGGWSWRHEDTVGNMVCVTEPARSLKSFLDPNAKAFDKIREFAGEKFEQLFALTSAYKPVDEFRVKCIAALGTVTAKKLIKLVTTESKTSVSFEVAGKEEA